MKPRQHGARYWLRSSAVTHTKGDAYHRTGQISEKTTGVALRQVASRRLAPLPHLEPPPEVKAGSPRYEGGASSQCFRGNLVLLGGIQPPHPAYKAGPLALRIKQHVLSSATRHNVSPTHQPRHCGTGRNRTDHRHCLPHLQDTTGVLLTEEQFFGPPKPVCSARGTAPTARS